MKWRFGEDDPKNIFDVLEMIGASLPDPPLRRLDWRQWLRARSLLFSIAPDPQAFLYALRGGAHAFLSWGAPRPCGTWRYRVKAWRLGVIARRATLVFVNDRVTERQMRVVYGVNALRVPYLVDTDYFRPPASPRDNFWLVPGDNDRDEALVCALARAGHRMVRVSLDPAVANYHQAHREPLVDVRVRVPYRELRDLYQRASAVLLPLTSFNHPAGQTAILEALACDAPVVMSRGRTSTILGAAPGVVVCSERDVGSWQRAVDLAITRASAVGSQRAEWMKEHAPANVAATMLAEIRARWAGSGAASR